jgi:hypothetical protein
MTSSSGNPSAQDSHFPARRLRKGVVTQESQGLKRHWLFTFRRHQLNSYLSLFPLPATL